MKSRCLALSKRCPSTLSIRLAAVTAAAAAAAAAAAGRQIWEKKT